ncbi:coiled-coil domain-containing protein 132 [Clonorchis sinensis]|uniref:Coiled-coil domain-containing protein 132 n=1 Tax=Clonorchis sinensis TaxID=79923 RepID=G7YBF9_CLOSI|nr:coiled-coil domain-containing protein 132 [Clonorchis sinensis]
MTFDSGKYEIETSAGPSCRQLEDLKRRLQILDNQNKAVSRRVSELILEKHPLYEAELKGVLLLQADNLETLGLCRRIRHSLKSSANVLVMSRLTVLRNYRRRLRLLKSLHVMRHIRALQNSIHHLDSLLMEGSFYAAIEVHRESLVLLEDCRQYRCIEPIHLKLKALGSRIDDLLDNELEKSCEHFSEDSYATVQHAFELLGSTQTMFAQLQMHYVAAIQRRSLSTVRSYLGPLEDTDEAPGSETMSNYAELCDIETGTSTKPRTPRVPDSSLHEHETNLAGAPATEAIPSKHSELQDYECDEEVGQPQLIRQWHEYVVSKLNASRNRIWSEVSCRVETILKAMGRFVTEMSFKQISFILQTVNHFVKIGQEFSGSTGSDLLEFLRTSIHAFFKEFHRKHLERLRVFLGNETWEFCPVKSSFTVLDLQTSSNPVDDRNTGPLLSSTTLEVLRLIGRYLQMMRLLQPIAAEVMHCICQVFDYYLYSSLDSVEIPDRLRLTLKRINERLIAPEDHPAVIKGDRFPLPVHEPMHVFNSVNRLMETLMDSAASPNAVALCSSYLQAHFVGVESVIFLADIFESMLLPHLSTCLPERKRGLTSVFREQALTAARQLREPCAMQIAPQLVNLLLTSSSASGVSSDAVSPSNIGGTIASSFSRIWSGNSTEKDSAPQRTNRLVSSARNELTNDTNFLTSCISSMLWTHKDVATTPSSYVHQLHTSVLSPFGRIMQALVQRLGLCDASKLAMWNAFLTCVGNMLLSAYGQVQLCSEEGRGQMLLDVQSISAFAEMESKIRSFPNLDRVIEYIQAFYVPVHEWEHWLTHTGTKYSRAQLTGLAHCLARGDRRQRQRLLNTINQIYGSSGIQASTAIPNIST